MTYFGCVNKFAQHVYFLAKLKYANELLKDMSRGYICTCPPSIVSLNTNLLFWIRKFGFCKFKESQLQVRVACVRGSNRFLGLRGRGDVYYFIISLHAPQPPSIFKLPESFSLGLIIHCSKQICIKGRRNRQYYTFRNYRCGLHIVVYNNPITLSRRIVERDG